MATIVRAFLTGATGTVGREAYRALRSRGVEIRIAARKPSAVDGVLPGIDVGEAQARDMMLQVGTPAWLVEAGLRDACT